MIVIKSDKEIEVLAEAGRIAGLCLKHMGELVQPGISTKELDIEAESFIRAHGALPTFKGYGGFPASICTSINHVVVHGVPDNTRLKEGDIISVDVGATFGGFVGDTAATFPVGKVSETAEMLILCTRESLEKGIAEAVVGGHLGSIGYAVESHAKKFGYSVVRDYAGHGVGRDMHEEPLVPNFGVRGTGRELKAGMVIAIEPMVNVGTYEVITHPNMSVVTKDGSLSAHFEHTVAITEKGPQWLTLV